MNEKMNEKMTNLVNVKTLVTHGGVFHADDTFSTALLQLLFEKLSVPMPTMQRVFKVPEDTDNMLVYDIGFGRFDHHQEDSETRPNGVPYASFGLLWREFAEILVSPKAKGIIDAKIVQPVDAADNGIYAKGVYTISQVISAMNPNPVVEGDLSPDEAFDKAVNLSKDVLKREIQLAQAAEDAEAEVMEALDQREQPEIVVLKRFCPWQSLVSRDKKAFFVVFPSLRGGFNVQCVPAKEPGSCRRRFPADWRGASLEKFSEMGVPASFCHPAGFLVATDTLKDAIRVANMALEG